MGSNACALLLITLPLLNMAVTMENRKRMEKIRRLYEHDGIDTGTVHISYPHSPSSPRRLTKREAFANLVGQPRRHANITVRVTLSASGHALHLHLSPSQLHMHGALVKVIDGDDVEEQFHLRDEGCHFQGSLAGAGGDGMVSVHFCDGELVGGANDGHTEYCFHSHSLHSHRRHRRSRETGDEGNRKNTHSGESTAKKEFSEHKLRNVHAENKMKNVSGETNAAKTAGGAKDPEEHVGDLAGSSLDNEELYHTIVSWKEMDGGEDIRSTLIDDYIVIKKNKKKKNEENVRKKKTTPTIHLKNRPKKVKKKDRLRRQAENTTYNENEDTYDNAPQSDDPLEAPDEPGSKGMNPDYDPNKVPVAEFGVIFDEEYLHAHRFLYPTRDSVIRMLMVRYTGVQGLFGNPAVTGFNLKIQMKVIYLWKKNPSYYRGSKISLGARMAGAGVPWAKENADFRSTDVAALFSYFNDGGVVGLAYVGGVCGMRSKTFVTVVWRLNWRTDAHEFGHTLGLAHVPPPCVNRDRRGFMNSYRSRFPPCYVEFLKERLKTKRMKCLYSQDVNTTNIPAVELQPLYPTLALGLNYYCRAAFRNDSVFIFEEKNCKGMLCAVTEETKRAFSMAIVITDISGRPCSSTGDEVCIQNKCMKPQGNTTIPTNDSWSNSGTWGKWSSYAKECSSACGVGVRVSSRECSVPDRPEACVGYRYRALLCNTQPCPGDDLMLDQEIRVDRANYMCSLLKARNAPQSMYLKPWAKEFGYIRRDHPTYRCLVKCEGISMPGRSRIQRWDFGLALQVDGTPCSKVNLFMRHVRGVTARCLRGQCREFGCNGQVLEDGGKVMDDCGVCGGNGSSCQSYTKEISVGDEDELAGLLPAGAKDVLVALQPDSPKGEVARNMKLALVNKDDASIIYPGEPDCPRAVTSEKNPMNYAGTNWTVFDHVVLRAPGPLDQPMKIKANKRKRSPAQNVTVLLSYTLPTTFIEPPTPCENGGRANATTRTCDCAEGFYGRRCETDCNSPCYNGGVIMGKLCNCQCSCKDNPGADHTKRCRCLEGFAGPDCTQCTITCFNGGTLNNQTCECKCPPGCSKLDCSGCKYNKKMPWYKGQYGRGALEVSADLKEVNLTSSFLHRPAGHLWHHQLLVAVGVVLWWGGGASL